MKKQRICHVCGSKRFATHHKVLICLECTTPLTKWGKELLAYLKK